MQAGARLGERSSHRLRDCLSELVGVRPLLADRRKFGRTLAGLSQRLPWGLDRARHYDAVKRRTWSSSPSAGGAQAGRLLVVMVDLGQVAQAQVVKGA